MADPFSGPWTREEASASGQVFEFRLWALLTGESRAAMTAVAFGTKVASQPVLVPFCLGAYPCRSAGPRTTVMYRHALTLAAGRHPLLGVVQNGLLRVRDL